MRRPFNLKPKLYVAHEVKYGEKAKSASGKSYPKKLRHFKVVKRERGSDGNFTKNEEVHSEIGKTPSTIPIVLHSDQIEDNFSIYRGAFSNKGELMCGTFMGESSAYRRFEMEDLEKEKGVYFGGTMPRSVTMTDAYKYKCDEGCTVWASGKCGFHAILYMSLDLNDVTFPDLCALRVSGVYAQTSIMGSLRYIKNITGGMLANLPLNLNLHYEKLSKPVMVNGKSIYPDIPRITISPRFNPRKFNQIVSEMVLTRHSTDANVFKSIIRDSEDGFLEDQDVFIENNDEEAVLEEESSEETGFDYSIFDGLDYAENKKRLIYERFNGDLEKIKEHIEERKKEIDEEDFLF